MKTNRSAQAGVALPVMLLMVLTMAITSVYLIKSVKSSSINAANASYKSALVRSADYGLHKGFDWLNTQVATRKALLNADNSGAGYYSSHNATLPTDDAFWVGAKTVTTPDGDEVRYVIHRLCKLPGAFDKGGSSANSCMMTTHADEPPPAKLPNGTSRAQGSVIFKMGPQVHYMITSRLSGPRGGNVINQMVVLIGV